MFIETRSCAGRDKIGPHDIADTSWLTDYVLNPLNVGQIINNSSSGKSLLFMNVSQII